MSQKHLSKHALFLLGRRPSPKRDRHLRWAPWTESLERLPGGLFLYEERVERGRVIAFAEDPNFRGFWHGANRLFLNAVVLGPSAP